MLKMLHTSSSAAFTLAPFSIQRAEPPHGKHCDEQQPSAKCKCKLLPTFDYKGVSFIVFSGLSFQYHQTFDATRSARCKMQLRYCSFRVASSETTLNLTAGAMHPTRNKKSRRFQITTFSSSLLLFLFLVLTLRNTSKRLASLCRLASEGSHWCLRRAE